MARSLSLIAQTSLETHKYSGETGEVVLHYTIKNASFQLSVGLTEGCEGTFVDFDNVFLEASLLYDLSPPKEVVCVKTKPFEYRAQSKDPKVFTVSAMIAILSSQHEDMNFRVRLHGVDAVTKQRIPGLTVDSHPIQVISKPEVLRKKRQPVLGKRKRVSRNDTVSESLQRIEATQQVQQQTINQLTSALTQLTQHHIQQQEQQQQQQQQQQQHLQLPQRATNPTERFANAWKELLAAYNELPCEERPSKVRRLVHDAPAAESELALNLMDVVYAEGASNKRLFDNSNNDGMLGFLLAGGGDIPPTNTQDPFYFPSSSTSSHTAVAANQMNTDPTTTTTTTTTSTASSSSSHLPALSVNHNDDIPWDL